MKHEQLAHDRNGHHAKAQDRAGNPKQDNSQYTHRSACCYAATQAGLSDLGCESRPMHSKPRYSRVKHRFPNTGFTSGLKSGTTIQTQNKLSHTNSDKGGQQNSTSNSHQKSCTTSRGGPTSEKAQPQAQYATQRSQPNHRPTTHHPTGTPATYLDQVPTPDCRGVLIRTRDSQSRIGLQVPSCTWIMYPVSCTAPLTSSR